MTETIKQTQTTNYSLNSIAGYEDEKEEAIKLINLFKEYDKLKQLGISIPKGLILSGEPGVGKTLMAKVIAAESNVPFYEYEASEDDTPRKAISNLKKIYEEARKNAPSIVFIDELDEIIFNEDFISDISRSIMKTLLTELDGVKTSEGVLTIATSNNYSKVPSPLRRSGRMDKHIDFELPNIDERTEILKLYMQDKPLLHRIDVNEIASRTAGFNCADLKTLINEAMLRYIASSKADISNEDFYDVIPEIAFKGIKKNKKAEGQRDFICYHELGHFICEYVLNQNISSISIEKIGNVEGFVRMYDRRGYMIPQNDKIYSSETCKNKAICALAGFAAEKIFTGKTYSGNASDFNEFGYLVELMCRSGMLGSKYLYSLMGYKNILDGSETQNKSESGEDIRIILFDEYLEIANKIINDNKGLIEVLFKPLKEKGKLEPDEIESIILDYNNSLKNCNVNI